MSTPGTFFSNFEPLTVDEARALVDQVVEFDHYTEPMKDAACGVRRRHRRTEFVVSSAHPRLVNGKPSKNPRYLQKRPDLARPATSYLAEIGTRLDARDPGRRTRCISR